MLFYNNEENPVKLTVHKVADSTDYDRLTFPPDKIVLKEQDLEKFIKTNLRIFTYDNPTKRIREM